MNPNILNIFNELHSKYKELGYLNKMKSIVQQQIIDLEDKLYDNCMHNWIFDNTNRGEHTEFICSICQLSKR